MDKYTHLNEIERMQIYRGFMSGLSLQEIANKIGRHKSTISREIARNQGKSDYLYPTEAQKRADDRKARHGSKINREPPIKAYMLEKLKIGWSPGAIAGRWNLEHPDQRICAETIYQFVYHKNNQNQALWRLLARVRKSRGMRKKQRSMEENSNRPSIHTRPEEVNMRFVVGDNEADLVFNRGSQSANVLVAIERKSRVVRLAKNESKKSEIIIESLARCLGPTAKSCTFDRGTEFAAHHKLGIPTFFCDPGSPWQKGSVENMNGLLRRYLPFSRDYRSITQEELDKIAHRLNNTPRKILGFLTPFEVFMKDTESLDRRVANEVRPTGGGGFL
jgi:transposase, IS30 family